MPVLMAALCQAGPAVASPGPAAMGHPMTSGTFPWKEGGGRAQGACSWGG